MADDLNRDLPEVQAAQDAAQAKLGWRFDPAARVLWIPPWWSLNPPENPNVLIGALTDLVEVPRSVLLPEFLANVDFASAQLLQLFHAVVRSLLSPSGSDSGGRTKRQKVASSSDHGGPERRGPRVGHPTKMPGHAKVRAEVSKAAGFACAICGEKGIPQNKDARKCTPEQYDGRVPPKGPHGRYMELDHINPKSNGGRWVVSNLQLLCSSCNNRKGARLSGIRRRCR